MRPEFHFTAERGWINDPHGITARDGEYHAFFQYVPETTGRSITAVSQGAHGTVAINDNGTVGDTSDDFVTYTTNDPDYSGADSFTYTVTSNGTTETATVNVTVAPTADIAADSVTVNVNSVS